MSCFGQRMRPFAAIETMAPSSAPVLQRTPDAPALPTAPSSLRRRKEGGRWAERKDAGNPSRNSCTGTVHAQGNASDQALESRESTPL